MKTTSAQAILGAVRLSSLGACSPTPAEARRALSGPLTWTGEINNDGKVHTLHGDIASINQQIRAINPGYTAAETITKGSSSSHHDLTKRNAGTGNCNNFASGDSSDLIYLAGRLKDAGGSCTVSGDSCSRVGCENTSGLYMCASSSDSVTRDCSEIADYIYSILQGCGNGGANSGLSGQLFSMDPFNVVVGYGNCGDSPAVKPSEYTGPGPNGAGFPQCVGCLQYRCVNGGAQTHPCAWTSS